MPVETEVCPKCGQPVGSPHMVIGSMPRATIIRKIWKRGGFARATDGCRIGWNEHYCEHGHGSWRDVLKSLHISGRPLQPDEVIEEDDVMDWTPEDGESEDEESEDEDAEL